MAADIPPILILPYTGGTYDSGETAALLAAGYLLLTLVLGAPSSQVYLVAGVDGPILVLPYSSSAYDSGEISAITAGGYLVLVMPLGAASADVKLVLGLA